MHEQTARFCSRPWPSSLRATLATIGWLGLLGTTPWLLAEPQVPSWLAPALARQASAPLRGDYPDSVHARLQEDFAAEIAFAADAHLRTLATAHRQPDRLLALPFFALLAAAPWLPSRGFAARGRAVRSALLALIPLQLLFHGTSVQPLLGAWIDLWGNLTQALLTIQILADRFFTARVDQAVVLFFAEQSPLIEAALLRQLWALRAADLLLAAVEAALLLWLARWVRRAEGAPPTTPTA